MANRTDAIQTELVGAIVEVNQAAQTECRERTRVKAVKRFCNAIDDAVMHTPLWSQMMERSVAVNPPDWSESRALLLLIASCLETAHAELLRRTGYRIPPPPSVDSLVKETRESLVSRNRRPRWGKEHVDDARLALDKFVKEVRSHLKQPRWESANTLLLRCRRLGPVALLVFAVSHAEIKTGNEFQVQFGVSLNDFVKVEITVPFNVMDIGAGAVVEAVVTNSQISNLGATIDETLSSRTERTWFVEVPDNESALDQPGGQGEDVESPDLESGIIDIRELLRELRDTRRTQIDESNLDDSLEERRESDYDPGDDLEDR